jgi:hypothetical protein
LGSIDAQAFSRRRRLRSLGVRAGLTAMAPTMASPRPVVRKNPNVSGNVVVGNEVYFVLAYRT